MIFHTRILEFLQIEPVLSLFLNFFIQGARRGKVPPGAL